MKQLLKPSIYGIFIAMALIFTLSPFQDNQAVLIAMYAIGAYLLLVFFSQLYRWFTR